jgi:hypothetical protein
LNKTSLSLRTGVSEDLILNATLADGSSKAVTDTAVWTSDNDSIAYVTNGKITAVSTGQAVITAKYGNKTATITVQVEIPSRLEVNQSDIFMKVSDAVELNLLAYFSGISDGVDVTKQAEWTTSNDGIAGVSSDGVITAVAMGQVTIVGKYGGKSVSITVDVATPRKLSVNKSSLNMRSDTSEQTVLTATYASGESFDITNLADWSSDNADIASVTKGKILSYKVGHATITAAYGGKKVTISVDVDQATVITANKQELQLQSGATEQLQITAKYPDGTTEDITDKAIWSSNSTAIAQVKSGLVNAIDKGETKVTASYGDRTVTISVMVGIVAALNISQSTISMKEGDSSPISLSATFKDNTVKDVTNEAVWSSSNDKVAKFSNGVVKAYGSGKAIITVKYGDLSETVTVEVDLADKLSINLKQVVLPKNSSVQLILTAMHTDRTTEDVTKKAVWKSSSEKVADVIDGLVTTYSNGKATITATYGGKSATVPVEINVATKIYLNKKEVSMKSGNQQKLVLMAVLADESEKEVTADAEWLTSSYAIADIDKGNILGTSYGKTTITARYGGKTTTVKVIVDELKYLKIAEKNVKLSVNDTKQVHAKATYKDNSEKDVSIDGIWSTSNDQIADVKDGLIVAYAKGTAKITCKFAGKTVTLQVVVN